MITAVDTSVLLDVLGADPEYGRRSQTALRSCRAEGRLMACGVVWAEIAAHFPSGEAAAAALSRMEIVYSPVDVEAALRAGGMWADYRRRGGARSRVIADFLIGAHALEDADRLLTRDRGFYRTYFTSLTLLDPALN